MTDAPPDAAWFRASSAAEQAHALDAIVAAANGATGLASPQRLRHVSALIELAHLNRHPRTRVPVLRALGRCEGQFIAIPALQAELDEPAVALTAIEGLGRVGLALGGVAVDGWYRQQRPALLSPQTHAAVLLALARTGHPAVEPVAAECWRHARVSLTQLHTALAVAVSLMLVDDAELCLGDPDAASAAALHLAAVRHPHLARLLAPLRAHVDPQIALLVDSLLRAPVLGPDDHLLQLVATPLPTRALGRAARGLKVHPTDALLDAWRALCSDPHAADAHHQIALAMASGIPELQDAALDLAASGPPALLVHALRHAHLDTPRLRAGLHAWLQHDDDKVAKEAVRTHLNALHQATGLDALATSARAAHRLEWVRLQQNAWRDRIDRAGRSTLPNDRRRPLEHHLRQLITADPDPAVRRLALYTAGNLGLTALTDALLPAATDATTTVAQRQAGASALAEFPAPSAIPALTVALRDEPVDIVVFRLARALIRALRDRDAASREVARVALGRLHRAPPGVQVILTTLLGHCRDPATLDTLRPLATSRPQALAAAAITAIGRLRDPRSLDVLVQATRSPDPERRLRATEALGAVGGDIAADRLTDLLVDPEEDTDVRHLAAEALTRLTLPATTRARLPMPDLDDPCAVEILALRHTNAAQAIDAALLDRSLEAAIPGLSTRLLAQQAPDALRAFRTAEFFHQPGVSLPEGADAAPPVLLWVKGMEIWMHAQLSPLLRALHHPDRAKAVAALVPGWDALRADLAPGWSDPDSWASLCDNLARSLVYRHGRVQSLRVVAAALLVADGAHTEIRWDTGLAPAQRATLARYLVLLARERNPLTHQKAGTKKDQAHTRDLAIRAARLAVRLQS